MRIGIYLLAALSCFFFFASCGKEKSVETGGNQPATVNGNGVFKMKINGTQWDAGNTAYATIIPGLINITGKSKNNIVLSITLSDTLATTYVLNQQSGFNGSALSDSADLNGVSFTTNQGSDTADAGGIVVVTNIDKVNKTISGTFKFKVFRDFDSKQKQITEGSFDKLSYSTGLPSTGTTNTTDTFTAKIDNAAWTGKGINGFTAGFTLAVNATAADGSKTIHLSMVDDIIPGIYDLGDFTPTGFYLPTATTMLPIESGKLTILEHNIATKRIRGNFNFKATEPGSTKTVLITDGYFSVKYK